MTWRELANKYPEFVQWVVQTFGPLPDGPVEEADYVRFMKAYQNTDEKPDELELWRRVKAGQRAYDAAGEMAMPIQRLEYLLGKWADDDLWDYGVSFRTGWLTDKGKGL